MFDWFMNVFLFFVSFFFFIRIERQYKNRKFLQIRHSKLLTCHYRIINVNIFAFVTCHLQAI